MIHSLFFESLPELEISLASQHVEIFIVRLIQLDKSTVRRSYVPSGATFTSCHPNNWIYYFIGFHRATD